MARHESVGNAPRQPAFVAADDTALVVFAAEGRTKEEMLSRFGWFLFVAVFLLVHAGRKRDVEFGSAGDSLPFAVWFFALYSRPPPVA